ncbi:MAG: DUF167 family protein [Desulfobulbales bacterium]|nr:DUF167 family protein [Desulfobulbales bacterium]
MKCITDLPDNRLALSIYVQPRASRNRVAGMHGSSVKLSITAAPVDNKANEAVIRFIADLFKVPKSSVSIKSGRQGRHKNVILDNLALGEAKKILAAALSKK